MTSSTEVRQTSAKGGKKGSKLARFDLIPTEVLWELAEHYGKGAAKYTEYGPCTCDAPEGADHQGGCGALTVVSSGDRNWELGTDWNLNYAAALRHLNQFWGGEDLDDEMGSKHVIAAAWHCFALAYHMIHHRDLDTRPTTLAQRQITED